MTGIGAGGPSFAELREQDGCYVDKTLLIKDLLDSDDCGVYLFTRPRGFGKTTNLSMLDAFFNREYEGKAWFNGLEISKYRKYDGYRHAFPVIHLDLGNTEAGSYDSFLGKIREAVRDAFEPHRRLLEWPDLREPARRMFRHLDEGDAGREDLVESINLLSSSLNSYHGKNPVILINDFRVHCTLNPANIRPFSAKIIQMPGRFVDSRLKSDRWPEPGPDFHVISYRIPADFR